MSTNSPEEHPGLIDERGRETDWTPIERGEVRPVGINQQYPGLLDVKVTLQPTPPPAWSDRLANGGMTLGTHSMSVRGATVHLTPPDDELEKYVEKLDSRIAEVNAWYESEMLPVLKRNRERAEKERSEKETRLQAARDRAKDL